MGVRYLSKEDAHFDHISNYRSDGVKKGKWSESSPDYTRISFVLDNVKKNGNILDVGCNTGTIAIPLIQRGCHVKGIDIVPELVEKAKKNGVFADVCSAEDLSRFRDSEFDSVICSEVLEHLFDPEVAINEAFRVLKKAGTYVITIPHEESKICLDGGLGDYHHQNIKRNQIYGILSKKFDPDKIVMTDIKYSEIASIKTGLKAPQWLGIVCKK